MISETMKNIFMNQNQIPWLKGLATAVISAGLAVFISCGAPEMDEVQLNGILSAAAEQVDLIKGPVFVAVSKTDSFDDIEKDPMNNIAVMTEADLSEGIFSIDLTDTGIKSGDRIFIFAFSDNDYSEGIPYPSHGDIVGFYVNSDTLTTSYLAGSGAALNIVLNRYHYDHKSEVIGLIEGNDSGSVILIAYAGDFSSTDFSALDVNSVVGYKKINKSPAPCTFSMNIMPYGFDVPLAGVYIIALLDRNGNGIPDDGDMIGFPSESAGSSYPVPVTVDAGVTAAKSIRFTMPVYTEPDSDEPPLRLQGGFDAPVGYIGSDKPLYIIAAKGSDPNQIFENIRNIDTEEIEFKKLDPNAVDFVMELPRRKFRAGDQIFLFALWDLHDPQALPRATEGDKVGFVQNRSAFSYTLTLQEYDNTLEKNGEQWYFNGEGGYEFNINRKYYDHSASMRFRLEKGNISDALFANGNKVICMAVWETGTISTGYSINMDKIIGASNVIIQREIGKDYTIRYSMPIMPVLHESITPVRDVNEDLAIENVWILALLDQNGNGTPDSGEKIGFYPRELEIFSIPIGIYVPEKLPNPVYDGINFIPKNVRFSSESY